MFKTKLQELCHQKLWELPEYSCIRDGFDHAPRFRASVVVDGVSFVSTDVSKSYKEALNEAAKLAFFRLTGVEPGVDAEVPGNSDVEVGKQYLQHKQQLYEYAQSRTLYPPLYTNKREGPPHALQFQATVTIDGRSFESPGYYRTLKEAEHAAANAALLSLSMDEFQEIDTRCYTNLLHELTQKGELTFPPYSTVRHGPPHRPIFISSVEIEGEVFEGEEMKSKELAEQSAAKAAYMVLMKRELAGDVDLTSSGSSSEEPTKASPCLGSLTDPNTQNISQSAYSVNSCPGEGSVGYATESEGVEPSAEVPKNSDVNVGKQDHKHKHQLYQCAQHGNLCPPSYSIKREGPPLSSKFRATVTIGGKSFQSPGCYRNVKEAEHAAEHAAHMLMKRMTGELAGDVALTSSGSSSEEPTKASPCLDSLTDPNTQKISQSASLVNSSPGEGSVGNATESEEGQSSAATVALPDLSSLSITSQKKKKNMKTGNYLLCNKVRVYTSIPDTIPEGTVLLPIDDNKWVAVRLEFATQTLS